MYYIGILFPYWGMWGFRELLVGKRGIYIGIYIGVYIYICRYWA